MLNLKLSPATLIMLPLAIGLDVIGIILLCFGLDDLGITDIIGIVFIDTWLYFQRRKKAKNNSGLAGFFKNLFTGNITKYIVPTAVELTPYVGAFPTWTFSVLINLSQD